MEIEWSWNRVGMKLDNVGLTLDHVETDSDHDYKNHINNVKLTTS